MKKATCSVSGNLGILENKIYDSELEIKWLINEKVYINDPASLLYSRKFSTVPDELKLC